MKHIYKIFLLTLLIVIGQNSYGATTNLAKGTTGSVSWSLDQETISLKGKEFTKTTLSFTGSGAMGTYTSQNNVPWLNIRIGSVTVSTATQIDEVTIADGVKSISSYAFYGLSKITSLEIPSTVTTIGDYAFYGCTKLTKFSVGSSLNFSVVDDALYNKALSIGDNPTNPDKLIAYPAGKTSDTYVGGDNLKEVAKGAFCGNKNLKEIFLPATVTTIGTEAFDNCSNLNLIHLDGNYTTNYTVTGVAASGKIIQKNTNVISGISATGWTKYYHGDYKCKGGAWAAWSSNKSKLFFYAPEANATVNYALEGLAPNYDNESYYPWRQYISSYTSLEIDKNITEIYHSSLEGISINSKQTGFENLETITVEDGNSAFTVGEEGALYNASKSILYLYPAKNSATTLTLPETVNEIRPYACCNASNLTTVKFTGTVNTIGEYSFGYTTSLTHLEFQSETAPTSYPKTGTYSTAFKGIAQNGVLSAPISTGYSELAQKVGYGWTLNTGNKYGKCGENLNWQYSNNTLTISGTGPMYGYMGASVPWNDLKSDVITIIIDGAESISKYAFSYCSNATTLNLNCKTIPAGAFKSCSKLETVNLSENVEMFDNEDSYVLNGITHQNNTSPFEGCDAIKTVNIKDIAAYSKIQNISLLTEAGLSEKTLQINGVAFNKNNTLVIPDGATSLYTAQFKTYSNVEKLSLPATASTIDFSRYDNLKECTLPDNLKGISSNMFSLCSSLEKVNIPSSVTKIGANAFVACQSLASIEIPESVTSIGRAAFNGCTSLASVILNGGGVIEAGAFKDCSALNTITIGSGVSKFVDTYTYEVYGGGTQTATESPFKGCDNIQTINVKDLAAYCNIESIKLLTSAGLSDKTLQINGVNFDSNIYLEIPTGVTSVYTAQFKTYSNVEKLRLPSTVNNIDFTLYTNLKECILPSNLKAISANMFSHCSSLQHIDIPITVTKIGNNAFYGCSSLKTYVHIPESVTSIGRNAFTNCTSLTSVYLLGGGVIEPGAFSGCSSLNKVIIGSGVTKFVEEYTYEVYNAPNATAKESPFKDCDAIQTVDIKDLKAYCNIENISLLTSAGLSEKTLEINGVYSSNGKVLAIPEGVTSVYTEQFKTYSNLDMLSLPSTASSINFSRYDNLKECTLPDNLKGISSNMFSLCSSLEKVNIPSSVTKIGANAFVACQSLASIEIPESVTSIGRNAFTNCTSLTNVYLLGGGVIEPGAFSGCSSLNKVIIGSGVTKFVEEYTYEVYNAPNATAKESPFKDCDAIQTVDIKDLKAYCNIENISLLTSAGLSEKNLEINGVYSSNGKVLAIPEGVTSVYTAQFKTYSNLDMLSLPSTASSINFSNYTNLKACTLPDNLNIIRTNMFSGCSSLETVNIPANATNIENYAFYGCSNLKTSVVIPESVISVGLHAFANCSSLTSVTLNGGGTIEAGTFSGCSALKKVTIGSGVSKFVDTYTYDIYGGPAKTEKESPFQGCSAIETVDIKDLEAYFNITNIHLLTNAGLSTKTLQINGEAFTNSNTLYIPEGIVYIKPQALDNYQNVTKVSLPSTISYIYDFFSLESDYIEEIYLPYTLNIVTYNAISLCKALKTIVCKASNVPSVYEATDFDIQHKDITLKVPAGTKSKYEQALFWRGFTIEELNVYTANYTIKPGNNTTASHSILKSKKALSWRSSNEEVATVDQNGVIEAKNPVFNGQTERANNKAVITADLEDGSELSCQVMVPVNVELTDGQAYLNTEDIETNSIVYTREFTTSNERKWQAIVIPFCANVEDLTAQYEGLEIAEIYTVCPVKDTNKDGIIDAKDSPTMVLSKLVDGYTLPNVGYMIKVKDAATVEFVADDNTQTLYAAANNPVTFSTSRTAFSINSIYQSGFYARPGDNNYYLSSGGFSYASTKNVLIKPNRWYMHVEDKNYGGVGNTNNASLAKNIDIIVLGEDDEDGNTTGIDFINGESNSMGNDAIYTINGVKINNADNLPAGLYIKNGKKIVIR